MRLPCSFLALALLSTGCATIVSHSEYPVSFQSTPPGASFSVQDEKGAIVHKGVTPAVVTLDAGAGFFQKADYTVTYQLAGYKDLTRELHAQMDPWYIGNIVFGGLIGLLIVDPATGAMWKLGKECGATLEASSPKP